MAVWNSPLYEVQYRCTRESVGREPILHDNKCSKNVATSWTSTSGRILQNRKTLICKQISTNASVTSHSNAYNKVFAHLSVLRTFSVLNRQHLEPFLFDSTFSTKHTMRSVLFAVKCKLCRIGKIFDSGSLQKYCCRS